MAFSFSYIVSVIDKFTEPLSNLKQHMKEVEEQTKEESSAFEKYAEAGEKAFKALEAAGIARVMEKLTMAPIEAASEMENAMEPIKAMLHFTPEGFEEFGAELEEIGAKANKTGEEMAGMAAKFATNTPQKELGEITGVAAKLSTVFRISAEESADSLALIKRRMNLNTEAVGEYADAIALMRTKQGKSFEEISNIVSGIAPNMSNYNLAAGDMVGLSAAVANVGKNARTSMGGFNSLITLMQGYNVQSKALSTDAKGAIMDVLTRAKALADKQGIGAINEKFGGAAQFVKDAIGHLDEFKKLLDATNNSAKYKGQLDKQDNDALETSTEMWKQINIQVGKLKTALGDSVKPITDSLLRTVKNVVTSFAEFMEGHKWLMKIVMVIAMVVTGFFSVVAVVLTLTTVWLAFSIFFSASLVTMTGGLYLIVIGIGAVIALIYKYWDDIVDFFKAFFNPKYWKEGWEMYKQALGDLVDWGIEKFKRLLEYTKMIFYVMTFQYDKAKDVLTKMNDEDTATAAKEAAQKAEAEKEKAEQSKKTATAKSATAEEKQASKTNVTGNIHVSAEKGTKVHTATMTSDSEDFDLGMSMSEGSY
jgi:TP901 family phage tail tape measure protein